MTKLANDTSSPILPTRAVLSSNLSSSSPMLPWQLTQKGRYKQSLLRIHLFPTCNPCKSHSPIPYPSLRYRSVLRAKIFSSWLCAMPLLPKGQNKPLCQPFMYRLTKWLVLAYGFMRSSSFFFSVPHFGEGRFVLEYHRGFLLLWAFFFPFEP